MKHILLVDDHPLVRQALKPFLEHHGFACNEAEHGAAALAWLKQEGHVDLIVSDNQMPVMTGWQFLIEVRNHSHFCTIPFILYSGNLTDDMQEQIRQDGATAVLSKPINFQEFLSVITKALTPT